jgi:predicted ATPase/DNA-binding SARP family transcriptional activator
MNHGVVRMAKVQLRFLGPVQVEQDGKSVSGFESRKALALLCYLATHAHPVPRSQIATLFWEDKSDERSRANLSRVLNNLTTLLPGCFEVTRHTVQFVRSPTHEVDTLAFNTLEAQGSTAALAEALTLYRGEFLSDLDLYSSPELDIWLGTQRDQWRQRAAQVFLKLITYHTPRGEYRQAIDYTSRLLALEPWREEAHREMMMLLTLTGQRSAALIQYDQCRAILAEELAVEPSEETTALYERIREQALLEEAQPNLRSHRLPLVGRQEERARLVALAESTRTDARTLTWIEGEAGVGKTHLVEDVLHHLAVSERLVMRGACYEFGMPLPYQAITQALRAQLAYIQNPSFLNDVWLTELAQLLPEIHELRPDLAEPPSVSGEPARQRLFEAVARLLRALAGHRGPLVLFLDDLHWADQASLDLLHYLFHRLHDIPVWMICTYVPEEMDLGHPLLQLQGVLGREEHTTLIHLRPLTIEAMTQLTREMVGLTGDEPTRLAKYLIDKSEGNPFILGHLLQELQDQKVLQRTGRQWKLEEGWLAHETGRHNRHSIPWGVAQGIQKRINRLPPSSRSMLHIAAIIGQSFDPTLLQEAGGRDVDLSTMIQTWLRRRLVVFQNVSTYTFAHHMILQVVIESIPQYQRQQLHGQVAAALERLFDAQPEAFERLAYHYTQSGKHDRALNYLMLSAKRAEQNYAWEGAIHFYTQALALISTDDLERQYWVLLDRERVYNTLAHRDAQRTDLEMLERLTLRMNDDARHAEIHCRWAEWALQTGLFARGMQWTQDGVTLALESGHPEVAAATLQYGALCAMNQGEHEQARQWGQRALALYGEQADRRGRGRILGTLGVIARSQKLFSEAKAYLAGSIREWRALEYPWHLAHSLSSLALIECQLGDYGQALLHQQEALQLAVEFGDMSLHVSTHINMGNILAALGEYAEALTCCEEALSMARTTTAPKLEACALLCRGHIRLRSAETALAEEDYRASFLIQTQFHISVLRQETLSGLADSLLARGAHDEALALLSEATLSQNTDEAGRSELLLRQAEAYLADGDRKSAHQALEQSLALINEPDSRETPTPETWWRAGHALRLLGKLRQSEQMLKRGDLLAEDQAQRIENSALQQQFLRDARTRRVNAPPLIHIAS